MSTKKLQILGSLGNNIELDSTLTQEGKAADAKAVGDAISDLNALVGDSSVTDQITSAISEHKHDNLELYHTISGAGSISVDAAAVESDVEIKLSSDTYTDFSNITVVMAYGETSTEIQANADGTLPVQTAQPEFVLTLQSTDGSFDAANVTIECIYLIDVGKALRDYVLNVDETLSDDEDTIAGTIIQIDDTLSVAGAAADAKATGDAIGAMNDKVDGADEKASTALEKADIKVYPIVESPSSIIEPDTYQVLGTVSSLSVTLNEVDDGYAHEYCFEFKTGDNFFDFNISPEPKWVSEPFIESNKTYQVSILRGIGVIVGA